MAEVFPLDINDQIDDEDLSDDEFEEVSLCLNECSTVSCVVMK